MVLWLVDKLFWINDGMHASLSFFPMLWLIVLFFFFFLGGGGSGGLTVICDGISIFFKYQFLSAYSCNFRILKITFYVTIRV